MKNVRLLTIWTIVLNTVILVGAGHGLATIGIFEILFALAPFVGHLNFELSFSLNATYDQSLLAAALFSFLGQVALLVSIIRKKKGKSAMRYLGIPLLWIGYFYLSHNFIDDAGSQLSLFTGLPFFVVSVLLT